MLLLLLFVVFVVVILSFVGTKFCWGFFWTRNKRLIIAGVTATRSEPAAVSAGQLLVCNHKSYWDIIYLVSRYAPLFGVCHGEDGAVYVQASACRAIMGDLRATPSGRRFASIAEALAYASRCGAPLALFPERVSSNHEKCVLKPSNAFQKAASNVATLPATHFLFFTYGAHQGTAAYTGTCSVLSHAVSVLAAHKQDLRVDWLDASQAAACGTKWFDDAWAKGTQLALLRQTALSDSDWGEFLAKWNSSGGK